MLETHTLSSFRKRFVCGLEGSSCLLPGEMFRMSWNEWKWMPLNNRRKLRAIVANRPVVCWITSAEINRLLTARQPQAASFDSWFVLADAAGFDADVRGDEHATVFEAVGLGLFLGVDWFD